MGLDISHDTFHGAYSAFNRFRERIAFYAGFPPLELMEGYWADDHNPFVLLDYRYKNDELEYSGVRRLKDRLPIKWDLFEKHPLFELLNHSDCDGHINYGAAKKIADALETLLPKMDSDNQGGHIGDLKTKTEIFIKGCRLAYSKKEKLTFG